MTTKTSILLAATFGLALGHASAASAQDDMCAKMSGAEKAACMKNMGRADEMRGKGAQGKGVGAENGKGMAKKMEDDAKDKAKDKMKDKVKDEAKGKMKDKAKERAAEMMEKKGG